MMNGVTVAIFMREQLMAKEFCGEQVIRDITFSVFRSSRKSLELRLRDGHWQLTLPRACQWEKARQFVEERWAWIEQHHAKQVSASSGYQWGHRILYLGKRYRLCFQKSTRRFVSLQGCDVIVEAPSPLQADEIEQLIMQWYRYRAKEILPGIVEAWCARLSVLGFPRPQKLRITQAKTRFGSLNSKGTMMLSSQIMQLSNEHIDYIVAHEFCHFRQMNHSPRFYAELEAICPQWKRLRREIRTMILAPIADLDEEG